MKILEDLTILVKELKTLKNKDDRLKVLIDHSECKKMLNYVYDPFKKYPISSKQCLKVLSEIQNPTKKNSMGKFIKSKKPSEDDFFDFLDMLSKDKSEDKSAINKTVKWIKDFPQYDELILNILNKDLGINIEEINNVFPKLIPSFRIAKFGTFKGNELSKGSWFVSKDYKCLRSIIILNGDVKIYSQTGKEYKTLHVLKDKLEPYKHMGVVLDGDLCIVDKDGNYKYKKLMKEIMMDDHTISNPSFILHDLIDYEGFMKFKSDESLVIRLKNCWEFARNIDSIILPETILYNKASFDKMKNDNIDGLLIKKNCGYNSKTSKNVLSLKEVYVSEFKVVGVKKNDLGELECAIIEYKGGRYDISSGWSKLQIENPESLIGKSFLFKYKKIPNVTFICMVTQ